MKRAVGFLFYLADWPASAAELYITWPLPITAIFSWHTVWAANNWPEGDSESAGMEDTEEGETKAGFN